MGLFRFRNSAQTHKLFHTHKHFYIMPSILLALEKKYNFSFLSRKNVMDTLQKNLLLKLLPREWQIFHEKIWKKNLIFLLKWTSINQVYDVTTQSGFAIQSIVLIPYGPWPEKTCLRGFANNKGADQPAHPHRLISAFVIRLLETIISKLATSEISIF